MVDPAPNSDRAAPRRPARVGDADTAAAWGRVILHVDMDAFFASIEQLDDPSLRGRPVLVGGAGPRGVVAAASYEARAFGCHSAQPMSIARRRCPQAAIVRGRGARYRELSRRVFEILATASPLVQPVSIDEAYVDLTGTQRLLGDPVGVARRLREEIRGRLGLTASIGVAPNKFLAKLASDMDKPDGLTVIREADAARLLAPMPVSAMPGVGPAGVERLRREGVVTIGDLRQLGPQRMRTLFGSEADRLRERAFGRDDRPVSTDRVARSISHERTFPVDVDDRRIVRGVMLDLADQASRRLRAAGRVAHGVQLKIRYGAFQTISRSRALPAPANDRLPVARAAAQLYDEWASTSFAPVRLIGVAAAPLGEPAAQASLFADPAQDRRRSLDRVLDQIVDRFGKRAVRRGASLGGPGGDTGWGGASEPTRPRG